MPKSNTARRAALLASSSLGLAAIVSAGAALAPATALAQTATCTATTAMTGNGTAAVTIAGGTNNPGISCVYTGDTATVTTLGAITVSSTAPANIPLNGVNLSATGTSDINWTSTAGTVTGSSQTNGPVIEALTEQGNITLSTAGVTGSAATVTDGIRAISSGGGVISITTAGAVSGTNATTGDSGIEAVSTGGNGNVAITYGGSVSGRLYGIQARASGSGALTINQTGGTVSASNISSVAAIDAVTGTGLFTLNAGTVNTGTNDSIRDAHALRLVSGGNASISVATLSGRGLTRAVVDLTTSGGTTTSITASGRLGIDAIQNSLNPYATLAIAGRGGGDIQISTNDLRGQVDFAGLTGDASLNVLRQWDISGISHFGAGDDVVSTGANTILNVHRNSTFIFGGGADVFNNAGAMEWGTEFSLIAVTLEFQGLEAFNNSGRIRLGEAPFPGVGKPPASPLATDGDPDDLLLMPGATFTGAGDSLILMDISYSNPGQLSCDPALRDPATGRMPAADCLGVQGGATAGVTKLLLYDGVPGDRGFNNKIVLVDVAGGTSEAGHFILDERSDGYSPEHGGVIDKHLLTYALVYDADVQQHMLVSTPGANALQFALLPSVAQSLWRTSTGTWFERQADLRVGELPDLGGGVWLRVAGEIADRDAIQTVETASATLEYDGSFEQKSYAVTGGIDLIAGSGATSAYAVGLMAGYANAKFEYAETANKGSYDGFNVGGYASFLSGGLFVDAAVNANRLVLKEDVPELNLFPSGTILDTNLVSLGGQVEAGWRFPVMGDAFIEPLASVSYVRVKYDDLEIPSDDPSRPRIGIDYDDPTSLRAGLGGRIGLEQDYGPVRAQLSLLAKAWNEFEGENTAALTSVAGDTLMVDDFSGQFNEFAVGASLWSPGGIVSGFANFGGKFGDDYNARTGSVGVRVNW